MASVPETRLATADDAGRSCPYCRFPIKQGAEVATCGVCRAPHHVECWEENGGCAVVACAGGPGSAAAQTRVSAPGGSTTSPPAPPAPPYGLPPQRRSARGWLIGAAVLVVLAVAGGVSAIVLEKQKQPAAAPPPPQTVTVVGTATTGGTTITAYGTSPTETTESGSAARQNQLSVRTDVVDYSTNGVRYRYSPNLTDVVPGNGPFTGDRVNVDCYTTGESVRGNRYWARLQNGYFVPAYYLRNGHEGLPGGMSQCGQAAPQTGRTWPRTDVVSYSSNGVRYRYTPSLSDVVPGNGPFTGAKVTVVCFTEGQDVRGNSWWARLNNGYYLPAYYLFDSHVDRPAGAPTC